MIGRGGASIKDLRVKSGCQIEIGEEGSFETDVYIFGKTQASWIIIRADVFAQNNTSSLLKFFLHKHLRTTIYNYTTNGKLY